MKPVLLRHCVRRSVAVVAVLVVAVAAGMSSVVASAAAEGADGAWDATALPGTPSVAWDINESGVVSGTVGRYWPYNENRAVRWHPDGTTEYLATPTEPSQNHSESTAVNDAGQATGWVGVGSYWKEAVIWQKDGTMTRLGWPTDAYDSRATDINQAGTVSGYTYGSLFPFIWRPVFGGLLGLLDHPQLGWSPMMSTPRAINDAGQVVGYSSTFTFPAPEVAVVWETGGALWSVNVLPGLQGGDKTSAYAINNVGVIVGTSNTAADPSTRRAVIWERNATTGQWEVSQPAGLTGVPSAINDLGEIVGRFQAPGTLATHAFLWQQGVMTDLGTLPEDVNSEANAVNEAGQVVGVSRSATGEAHAVIWTLALTPLDRVAELIALVESYQLDELGNSLLAKLEAMQKQLEADKNVPVCGTLGAFLNEVEAQRDKGLTAEQADVLTDAATTLQTALGC